MEKKNKKYYYIEINLKTKKIIDSGIVSNDNMFDYPNNKQYRIFLTKGQYNKYIAKTNS